MSTAVGATDGVHKWEHQHGPLNVSKKKRIQYSWCCNYVTGNTALIIDRFASKYGSRQRDIRMCWFCVAVNTVLAASLLKYEVPNQFWLGQRCAIYI